jgi:ketosteroid isomerase-like protein
MSTTAAVEQHMTIREIIDAFLERLGRQEADGTAELFADDIDWYVPGAKTLPWTGRRSKRTDVAEYLRTLWANLVVSESTVDIETVLVEGDDAVVLSTFRHTVKRNGHTFTTPSAMRFHVANGKITKMHLYEDTAAVRDAFFD